MLAGEAQKEVFSRRHFRIQEVTEILPNPQNRVTVPTTPGHVDLDEALVPRATVTLVPRTAAGNDVDSQVMNLMNEGIDFLAQNLFGAVPGPKYTQQQTSLQMVLEPRITNPVRCGWVKTR